VAKNKGGSRSNDSRTQKMGAYCGHCLKDTEVERIMIVGKSSGLKWRCKSCQGYIITAVTRVN
jgi:hypothetical protein